MTIEVKGEREREIDTKKRERREKRRRKNEICMARKGTKSKIFYSLLATHATLMGKGGGRGEKVNWGRGPTTTGFMD